MGLGVSEESFFDELVYSKFPAPDLDAIVRYLPPTTSITMLTIE